MKLEEISLNEYEEFINSLGIKNTLIRMNNRSYIGIKENNKIIGVDMIGTAKRKTFGKYAYYSAIGPIFNKDDKEIIDFYINNIKEYVKNHDGYVFILGEGIAKKYNLEKEYPITRHYKLMKLFESIR